MLVCSVQQSSAKLQKRSKSITQQEHTCEIPCRAVSPLPLIVNFQVGTTHPDVRLEAQSVKDQPFNYLKFFHRTYWGKVAPIGNAHLLNEI